MLSRDEAIRHLTEAGELGRELKQTKRYRRFQSRTDPAKVWYFGKRGAVRYGSTVNESISMTQIVRNQAKLAAD